MEKSIEVLVYSTFLNPAQCKTVCDGLVMISVQIGASLGEK